MVDLGLVAVLTPEEQRHFIGFLQARPPAISRDLPLLSRRPHRLPAGARPRRRRARRGVRARLVAPAGVHAAGGLAAGWQCSTLFEDTAPSAPLGPLKARGSTAHPGAPPEQRGCVVGPQQPASGGPKVETFPPGLHRGDGRLLCQELPRLRHGHPPRRLAAPPTPHWPCSPSRPRMRDSAHAPPSPRFQATCCGPCSSWCASTASRSRAIT